jgi:hypothetical protein
MDVKLLLLGSLCDMAGDWIKWTVGLVEKLEVARMASDLKTSREVVACRLMRFWEWADANISDADVRPDGSAFVKMSPERGDNSATIDAIVGALGFADSLSSVSWLRFRDGGIELPNFGRHNGETAKTRARNAKNQGKKRGKKKDVTEMSPERGDKKVTRVEKSREESNGYIPGDEVVVPNSVNTPECWEAAGSWFRHLEQSGRADKVPERNSEAEGAFWAEAYKMGSEVFIDAVQYSKSGNWVNIKKRPVEEASRNGKSKNSGADSRVDRERRSLEEVAALLDGQTGRTGRV